MKAASDSIVGPSSAKPSDFVNAPTLIGRKIGHWKARPMSAGRPDNEDTGVSMPENCVAGRTVRIAVPNSAAIWELAKAGDHQAVAGRHRHVDQGSD